MKIKKLCPECRHYFKYGEEDITVKPYGRFAVCPNCGFNVYSVKLMIEK